MSDDARKPTNPGADLPPSRPGEMYGYANNSRPARPFAPRVPDDRDANPRDGWRRRTSSCWLIGLAVGVLLAAVAPAVADANQTMIPGPVFAGFHVTTSQPAEGSGHDAVGHAVETAPSRSDRPAALSRVEAADASSMTASSRAVAADASGARVSPDFTPGQYVNIVLPTASYVYATVTVAPSSGFGQTWFELQSPQVIAGCPEGGGCPGVVSFGSFPAGTALQFAEQEWSYGQNLGDSDIELPDHPGLA